MNLTDRTFWTWPRLTVALLLLVFLVTVIWVPRLVDARAVVDLASRAVESSTGRRLVVKGEVSVRLWPRLSVVAEDVHFGNAAWATDPDMATAQRLALSLNWLPLLRQSVSINQAELDGLVLNLQAGAKPSDGAGNWNFTPAGSDASSASDQSAFRIEKIQFNDARLQIRDRAGNVTETVSIDRADANFSGEAVNFKGGVVWHQQPLDLKGRFEYPDKKSPSLALTATTRILDLSQPANALAHKTVPMAAPAQTQRGNNVPFWQDDRPLDFSMLPQFNLQIDLTAGQVVLPNGAIFPNVSLSVGLDESASGNLSLKRFTSGFGKGQITASGAIQGYTGPQPTLSLKANANGFDVAKIFSMQTLKLPKVNAQGGAVQVDVDLTATGRSPRQLMATLTGTAKASVGAGTLTVNDANSSSPRMIALQTFNGRADFKSGTSPQLNLDLTASRVNLDAGLQSTGAAAAEPKANPNRRWLFGTDTLAFNAIPLMNGQIALNVTELVLPDGIVLPNFILKASLQDTGGGVMKVDQLKSGFGQGVLMADGVISQYTTAAPTMRLRGHARDFRLDHLIAQMDQKRAFGKVQGGQGEIAFHFAGQGTSLRTIVSGMNGEFQFSVNKATLPRALVDSSGDFLLSVINTVNPIRTKSDVTQLDCAVGYLPVRNGMLTIDNSVGVETDQLDVVLSGQVNLKQEQMSINIQSNQKSGLTTGVNAAGLVVVQGTLLNPSLGVNKTGVVKQAASVGLAVVTGGISLAAQNVVSVATRSNPCQNVLRSWSTIDGQLMSQGAAN